MCAALLVAGAKVNATTADGRAALFPRFRTALLLRPQLTYRHITHSRGLSMCRCSNRKIIAEETHQGLQTAASLVGLSNGCFLVASSPTNYTNRGAGTGSFWIPKTDVNFSHPLRSARGCWVQAEMAPEQFTNSDCPYD